MVLSRLFRCLLISPGCSGFTNKGDFSFIIRAKRWNKVIHCGSSEKPTKKIAKGTAYKLSLVCFGTAAVLVIYSVYRMGIDRQRVDAMVELYSPPIAVTREKSISPVSSHLAGLYLALPYQILSAKIFALLFHSDLAVISKPLIQLYSKLYKIKLEGCQRARLEDYNTLAELFTREPAPFEVTGGEDDVNSPCEGTLVGSGEVLPPLRGLRFLRNIKGRRACLSFMLLSNSDEIELQNPDNSLYYAVVYLSPADVHRFYAPVDFRQHFITQINGFTSKLVGVLGEEIYGRKLCLNHRVVIEGEWKHGLMYMIPVGALNVGSVYLSSEQKQFDNQQGVFLKNTLQSERSFRRGQEMGYFTAGSSILLVFEGPKDFQFATHTDEKLKIMQRL